MGWGGGVVGWWVVGGVWWVVGGGWWVVGGGWWVVGVKLVIPASAVTCLTRQCMMSKGSRF